MLMFVGFLPSLDAQVLLVQFRLSYLMADVFRSAFCVFDVLQDVHTLGVGAAVNCEWTPKRLRKLPADTAQYLKSIDQLQLYMTVMIQK